MDKKKVLAVGAHPDDMEQFAGGTLALLTKEGHEVLIAAMTAGECGSRELLDSEVVEVRRKESEEGAKIIGAKFTNLGIRDGSLSYDLETSKKMVKLIREFAPDIIITHPVIDYMADHAHTGRLVLWAVPEATHKNFPADTKASSLTTMSHIYHTDPQGLIGPDGQIVRVNTIVDISETIEQKLKAFAAHNSQMGFLEKGKINAVEKTRRWAIARGQQVRVEYGEGFYQELLEEYPRKNILVELLIDKVFTL
ncbi:MAG: PIG-L family deacetylase [Candidatus Woykebacteria bacterium]